MFTVRNRFQLTKYTLEQLFKSVDFDKWRMDIFLYDNLSEFDMEERGAWYGKLLKEKWLTQVTFNTAASTDKAFSKAAANNQFADLHMNSLNRKKIKYLIMMDNDMLCFPGWLDVFDKAWDDIKSVPTLKDEIVVVTQYPGGVMGREIVQINGTNYHRGTSGGSGLWVVKNNFYHKIGKLNLGPLVGKNKAHDQRYWYRIQRKTGVYKYAIAVPCKKVLHLGGIVGSVCNSLHKNGGRNLDQIEKGFEERIKGLTPEQVAEKYPNFFNW